MKTLDLFGQLSSLMRQPTLKIRVEHENLETVYVEPAGDGRILIHDRAHAYSYLSTGKDSTYRDWADLGVDYLSHHCDQLNLTLENLLGDESGPGFCICAWATTDLEVAELVDRVAVCQDAIFQGAYRNTSSSQDCG